MGLYLFLFFSALSVGTRLAFLFACLLSCFRSFLLACCLPCYMHCFYCVFDACGHSLLLACLRACSLACFLLFLLACFPAFFLARLIFCQRYSLLSSCLFSFVFLLYCLPLHAFLHVFSFLLICLLSHFQASLRAWRIRSSVRGASPSSGARVLGASFTRFRSTFRHHRALAPAA